MERNKPISCNDVEIYTNMLLHELYNTTTFIVQGIDLDMFMAIGLEDLLQV